MTKPPVVSIHASSREDATRFVMWIQKSCEFQSTRPRGRTRHADPCVYHGGEIVSIHASSREDATALAVCHNPRCLVSIHASSREDATSMINPVAPFYLFQSTRPRGRTRLDSCAYVARYIMFQSTRPRGRTRPLLTSSAKAKSVSIHASSREDATNLVLMLRGMSCFNPRVLAGGRDFARLFRFRNFTFQSTRPRGRTRHTLVPSDFVCFMFQSTRPRGRTRLELGLMTKPPVVSIHASSREDATCRNRLNLHRLKFQSTRPRGRTRRRCSRASGDTTPFQSTRPRGRTRRPVVRCLASVAVSIHASSREDATVSVESNINQNVTFAKARRK